MQRISFRRILGVAAMSFLTLAVLMPENAEAKKKYRYHGSSGSSGGSSSSHGSSGSSGGWYSSHGSSGSSGGSSSSRGSRGSSGSSSSHGSSGSSGGWYSSHGSSGSSGSSSSHGSSGSSGSSSSHGSSGSSGGVVIHHKPADKAAPSDDAAPMAAPTTAAASNTDRHTATLVFKVPADATVYLVGQKMSITGPERRFRIPVTDAGRDYTYPVRVELERNGKTLVSETKQKIRGGQRVEIAVAESDADGELVAVAMR